MYRKGKKGGGVNEVQGIDGVRLMSLVIGGLMHDAKGSITILDSGLRFLKNFIEDQKEELLKEFLELDNIKMLVDTVHQLGSIIDTIHATVRPYYTPEYGEPGKSNLQKLAREFRSRVAPYPDCKLTFHGIKSLPVVRLQVGIMRFIISELIQNAAKASFKSKKNRIRVAFQYDDSNRMLKISVADSGIGFPEPLLSQFQRGHFHVHRKDLGKRYRRYGLFLISEIAGRLGGQLTVRNRKIGGALVEVFLSVGVDNHSRKKE